MKSDPLDYLPEATEALVAALRNVRDIREAESLVSYLRNLGETERTHLADIKRELIGRARHMDGTEGSD